MSCECSIGVVCQNRNFSPNQSFFMTLQYDPRSFESNNRKILFPNAIQPQIKIKIRRVYWTVFHFNQNLLIFPGRNGNTPQLWAPPVFDNVDSSHIVLIQFDLNFTQQCNDIWLFWHNFDIDGYNIFKQMSKTKQSLTTLLKTQIDQLHHGVVQMDEQSLLKQLAKRKVLYNITRQGQIQVVYSYLALSEYYIKNGYPDAALCNLKLSREMKLTGDSSYLIGTVYYNAQNQKEALNYFEASLSQQWIEPSIEHVIATKLECMTQMQKIYYNFNNKDKLISLAQQKINLAKQQANKYTQTYFHALSLADLSVIHDLFGQPITAIQKIEAAIMLLEQNQEDPQKLINFYKIAGSFYKKYGKPVEQKAKYVKALNVIARYPKCVPQQVEADIYQSIIKGNLYA